MSPTHQHIASGDVDLIFMNRMLVVDPELPKKLEEGQRDEIAPCTKCFHCHAKPLGEAELCRVNATTQFACTEEMPNGYALSPAEKSRNVMSVGGDPAAGIEVYAVGCDIPKNIQSAIHAGNIVARSL